MRDRRVQLRVAALRVGVRLGSGHLVRAHGVGAGERRAEQLAHAVGHAGSPGRGHHQAEQVRQEGALGRQGTAAAELGVAGIDRVIRRHAEREPAGLVAAVRGQGLADQRDQPDEEGPMSITAASGKRAWPPWSEKARPSAFISTDLPWPGRP